MLSYESSDRVVSLTRITAAATVGAVVGQMVVVWTSLCGASVESLITLLAALTAATLISDALRRSGLSLPGFGLATVILMTLIWLAPDLMNTALSLASDVVGLRWPMATMLMLAFPALVVAMTLAAAGVFFQSVTAETPGSRVPTVLMAVPGTSILLLHGIAAWQPWPMALTVAAMIAMTVALKLMRTLPMMAMASHAWPERMDNMSGRDVAGSLLFAATGIVLMTVIGLIGRILPLNVPVLSLAFSIAAIGLLTVSRPIVVRMMTPTGLTLISAFGLAMIPVSMSAVTTMNLSWNASGLSPWLIIAAQGTQLAVALFFAMLPLAVCPNRTVDFSTRPQGSLPMLAGAVIAIVAVSRGLSEGTVLGFGIAAIAVAHALTPRSTVTVQQQPTTQPARRLLITGLATAAAIVTLVPQPTSELSQLFSSNRTIAAMQRGIDQEMILQTDSQRLLTTARSGLGEIAVWSRSGNVFEFQLNGRSLGRISADTTLSPQQPEEILPAVLPLVCHPQPGRVLLIGDETGVCLQTCTHFPVQRIVAIRPHEQLTELARRFTWRGQATPPDQDDRVTILPGVPMLSIRERELQTFDVVIVTQDAAAFGSSPGEFSREFYQAAAARLSQDGMFCQRVRMPNPAADALTQLFATVATEFDHAGIVQVIPGEFLLLATNAERGLIDSQILSRLQRDHVQREIASAGWDWSQVAVLPLVKVASGEGMLHGRLPGVFSISNGRWAMAGPFESTTHVDRSAELQAQFGLWQMQLNAAVESGEDHKEAQRRLDSLVQEREILTGMPDEPWTYRKSLRMELQRNPRPPEEVVGSGNVVRKAHPLDTLRREYFETLGATVRAEKAGELHADELSDLARFTEVSEPLLSHFAHYELIRFHELAGHPSPADEFRHRLHVVFYSTPADASVRPVIGAIRQLVDQPTLVLDDAQRFDQLNALVQKLIERWEARTAWEPRSVSRVQTDVDQSVQVAMLALDQMEAHRAAAGVSSEDFRLRRKFVTSALITPLHDYREQVLAHRLQTEPLPPTGTEDPDDLPLMVPDAGLNTN